MESNHMMKKPIYVSAELQKIVEGHSIPFCREELAELKAMTSTAKLLPRACLGCQNLECTMLSNDEMAIDYESCTKWQSTESAGFAHNVKVHKYPHMHSLKALRPIK